MNDTDDIVVALTPVVQACDSLGIRYFIGGSVASSFHGATRSTLDVDMVVELENDSVTPLLKLLGNDYYASEPAIRNAIKSKACFNLIHYATSFKVDIFVSRDRAFDQDSFTRAVAGEIGRYVKLGVMMASPEDTIVSKLEWYKLGNEASERQWQDVTRVLQLLGDRADKDYLQRAAKSVGVEDLLIRLFDEHQEQNDGHPS